MKERNLVLGTTFRHFIEKPKWVLHLILWIIIVLATVWLSSTFTDWTEVLKQSNPDLSTTQIEQSKALMGPVMIIGGIFGQLFYLLVAYLIVWAIARIFKSDVRKRSIFAGTLFALLISSLVAFIVLAIQAIVGLDIVQYSITSLNIFDKGNKILGAFNLQTLLSGYLLFLLLNKTCKLSTKVALIFSIILVIVSIGSGIIGGLVAQ